MSDIPEIKVAKTPEKYFINSGLFSDHYLQSRLPNRAEWKTDQNLNEFHQKLLALYESQKPHLSKYNEAQTEQKFIKPVLDLLGYSDCYVVQPAANSGTPDYALFPNKVIAENAHIKQGETDYRQSIGIADAKYWERNLDKSKHNTKDTYTNKNPSFQIVNYLIGTKTTWGILTNGRQWRLYTSRAQMPIAQYYEVDVVQLLESSVNALKYFYLFFRKNSLLTDANNKTLLDYIFENSSEYAVELENNIKERAYEVVQLICQGFAANFKPEQMDESALKQIYDNSLTFLYRLLFVFYAEARDLLPLTENHSYRDTYSIRSIILKIEDAEKKNLSFSYKSTNYYQSLINLFKLIDSGDSSLNVPEYNGGLFDSAEHPFIKNTTIADFYLVKTLRHLAWVMDKELGFEVLVDYNTLSERHLGSIYEGLLEFKPAIASEDLVEIKEKNGTKYAPAKSNPTKRVICHKNELYLVNIKGERKSSGSYYTPEYIVNFIIENTLDVLIKEAQVKAKYLKPQVDVEIKKWQELKRQKQGLEPLEKYDKEISKISKRMLEPYLSLKILDPAMGSGHFLTRATDFIAMAIASDPSIESSTDLDEEAEIIYYRRRVVESCIYGVDLNPLAVELAKLTLWLSTMAKSKPLSFLNHHLKCGNSLIGAKISDLDEILGVPSKKKKAKIDPTRAPVQIGQFEGAFKQKLIILLKNRAMIAELASETLEDIHNKQKWENNFQTTIERFGLLADLWVSTYFGRSVDWGEYNTLALNLQSPNQDWDSLIQKEKIQKARNMSIESHFFHWELEFPEVFYDEQGVYKQSSGFDAVIGNPPYDVLEKERLGEDNPHLELAHYLETNPIYYDSLGGKVNLFRPFIVLNNYLLKNGGFFGNIIPLAIANDYSCSRTRKFLLNEYKIHTLECFPQKDDANNRVFQDAKLSTCIVIAGKPGPTLSLSLSVYPGKALINNPKKLTALLTEIKTIDADGVPIPLMDQSEWIIALKIHSKVPSQHISDLGNLTRGEINQTIFLEYITTNPLHREMIKGVEISKYSENWYLSQGEKQWFNEELFLQNVKTKKVPPSFRLGIQRITGIDDKVRLTATFIERKVYFADSTNSVSGNDKNKLYYLLTLINSHLLNWRFQLTSSNNNVSTNELDNLPIRTIKFRTLNKIRNMLVNQGTKFYQEYLETSALENILSFVGERLPLNSDGLPDIKSEQSDVVYDLLVYLAKEMLHLNNEKLSIIKDFLEWLEAEILKSPVEEQKNKTKLRRFYDYSFENLEKVLKENKVIPDPCPSDNRNIILQEFNKAMTLLAPLITSIKLTDELIDQIIYKLYGLTDDEIKIIENI